MARAIRIHKQGGPEVLQVEELDIGEPGPGEARIRVEAVGLNRAEAMYRAGRYPVPCELPSRMGYEGVGTIEALGNGVEGFAVGQRVCVLPMTTPDRNVMAAVDSYLFFEDGGELGVFIYYDDPRTKRDIDYIEFYDTDGNLLIVTWIDHLGICHVALDQGLLNEEDPAVDGTLILVDVGVGI